ncbi:MAG: TetR/AcrR family transcriptional regulator [Steroidobacteraceae bacterium]
MTTATAVPEKTSARERLLAAAQELFYEEGIHTVGIERVIERAGVAKASLYNTFGSKDELIRAYLQARQDSRRARLEQRLGALATPREKVLAIFQDIGEMAGKPDYRGCAFVRASAELSRVSGVKNICDQSRLWLRALLTDLARAAEARDPEALARQLVLLYDGTAVSAQMDGPCDAGHAARAAATQLLDAAGAP